MIRFVAVLVTMLAVLYTVAVAPAQAMVRPKVYPGISFTTDGAPTRFRIEVSKDQTKVTCVDIRTAPGKTRIIKFRSSGTLIKKIRVKPNHNTPGKCETSFLVTARRLTVNVQEDILIKHRFSRGHKTIALW